jgi:hypothetical protein
VVPIFRRQIERGGPITVTDERMTRYFMTIPEAVQLIIRSGSLASEPRPGGQTPGADVFVLEMGEPVRIVDLAREMIELSGLDPDRDIDIEIVGARPGEKIHEALFNSYARPGPTGADKILLARREPLAVAEVESMFREIILLVLEGDATGLAAKVAELSTELRGQSAQRPGGAPAQPEGARAKRSEAPREPAAEPEAVDLPAAAPGAVAGARKIIAPPARDGHVTAAETDGHAPAHAAGRRQDVEDAGEGAGAPEPLVHSPNS